MPLTIGQILQNRYRIDALLGQGGFGAVYRATDLNINFTVALKENQDFSSEAQRQFVIEASLLVGLRHPGLPRVTDYFFIPGQGQYLVMDYIAGQDLKEMLDQHGPLDEAHALAWMGQALDALAYLHAQNPPIIHRDVKPANIRVTPDGHAMLLDLGVAKVYDPSLLTATGARAVTPGYSPWEQYGQGGTDTRSDVYAAGATLYTVLTGQTPPESMYLLAGSAQLAPPRALNPRLSSNVEAVILRAMNTQPADRYTDAGQMRAELGQTPMPGTWPAQKLVKRPRLLQGFTLLIGVGILVAMLAQVIIVANIMRAGPPTPPRPTAPIAMPTAVSPAISVQVATLTPVPTVRPVATPTVTPTAVPPTSTPSPTTLPVAGETRISGQDGMIMIYVPAGEFLMGSADSDKDAAGDEKPQHKVYLDAFWIDQTEVTNVQFTRFVTATGHTTDAEKEGWGNAVVDGQWRQVNGADWRHPGGPTATLAGLDNWPAVLVSWNDAKAYCQWAGRQLPTEAQWEKAARGTDGRIYPWGNQNMAGNLLNFADRNLDMSWGDKTVDDGYRFAASVGSYPAGASPYGALDLAGNVWEWVADWYADPYYANSPSQNPPGPSAGQDRVMRGGGWSNIAVSVRAASRRHDLPSLRHADVGFRCAR